MAKKKSKITKEQVKHIAELARIKLTAPEVKKFQKQLGDIISYFDKLQEVDTQYIEETSQVTGLVNRLRNDDIKEVLDRKEALENAPKKEDGYFETKLAVEK